MAAQGENKTVTVIHTGLADYKSIVDALKVCDDGDTVIVKIGQYDETVVLDKCVHIQGDSEQNTDIRITGGVVCTTGGSIKGLSVQGLVDIRSGNVLIENCDIFSGADGIRVHKDANPTIVKNSIHDAHQGGDGIYFGENSKGTVMENEIFNNRMNGVHVNGSEVVVKNNKIYNCPYGVYFRRGGQGLVERNDIQNIPSFGVYVTTQADPVVTGNKIETCGIHCVMISTDGKGTIKDNNITGNLTVKRGCNPVVGVNMVTGRIENENIVAAEVPV